MTDERLPNGLKPEWDALLRGAKAKMDHARTERAAQPLQPPWLMFPEPRISLRWRMGPGESYLSEFQERFRSLSPRDRRAYMAMYQEPEGWTGFYENLLKA